jgi:osmoprotectant transport system permease protein
MSEFTQAFPYMADHLSYLSHLLVKHIELAGATLVVATAIALPLGVVLGHAHRFSWLAINIANAGRALPSLGIIAIGLGILGIGFLNVLVALVILVIPPVLTNAYVAIDGVDRDIVEAARGMGLTGWQILRRVELPIGLPLLFAGLRIGGVFAIGDATIASIAGGTSLGDPIVNPSLPDQDLVAAALWVAALAIVYYAGMVAIERLVTPRGLRGALEPLGVVK